MGLRTWRNHNFYHLPKAFLPRDKHGKKRPPAVPGPVIFTVNDRMLHAISGSSRLLPAKITGPGLRSNRLRIPFSAKITSKHSRFCKDTPVSAKITYVCDSTFRRHAFNSCCLRSEVSVRLVVWSGQAGTASSKVFGSNGMLHVEVRIAS